MGKKAIFCFQALMKYLYGNFILIFWNSTHFLGNKSQILIPSKYTKAWMAGFSSLPQGDGMMKTPLALNSSFGSSNACGQQEHVLQGCVFPHVWGKPCNLFFSKGRKRVKHYFRCHVDLSFSLSFWVQFLASLVQTGMGWIYEAYLCLSRPFLMVAGAGFFITPLLSLPLHTHGEGPTHISEDLSVLSLAFTGDPRWLEEFAVKDTWIWVLKHLIV